MSRTRPFAQVDVFSSDPCRGNPLAVVLDGTDLVDETMQRFAAWTNLSETTFVLPPTTPEADYRVRIFTPGGELPFAGHPTLGTAHAWLERGGRPQGEGVVVQECAAGLVEVRRAPGGLSFAAPPLLRSGPLDEEALERIAGALGLGREAVVGHQWVDNGPGWAAVRLATAEEVLAVRPDFARMPQDKVGVVGHHPEGSEHLYEVRAFVPRGTEDPVTGSLNAGLAQWLIGEGVAPRRYRAVQGTAIGRHGVIDVDAEEDGTIWVGGATTTLVQGEVRL